MRKYLLYIVMTVAVVTTFLVVVNVEPQTKVEHESR